jgi:hypothetical protein
MAWCPFAIHKPLSENHWQGSITPRAVILHTAVSGASSLFGFFQNNSNLESHFYVRNDGTIEQYMDTGIRADANKNANDFAVSIETQDDRVIKPWTAQQVDALVRLVSWICNVHGIAKRQIPSAYGEGIGWHVQFGAPGPWTPVSKSCPGSPRIEQTKNVIIPRVRAGQSGGGGSAPGVPEEDDMGRVEEISIPAAMEIAKAVCNYRLPEDFGENSLVTRRVWQNTRALARRNSQELAGLRAAVDKLADAVASGGGSSAAELKAAVAEAIQENVVKVDVTVAGDEGDVA